MNSRQALSHVRKLLGKSGQIRDYGGTSSPLIREVQRAARKAASEAKNAAEKAMQDRRAEILAADAEYQRLKAEYTAASAKLDKTPHGTHYRYSAGKVNGVGGIKFFHVDAEGDNLQDLIDNLTRRIEERRV